MSQATNDLAKAKKRQFRAILIANRGEIAVRIIKTARRLGYKTIAVFSDPDRSALHVKLADQAVAIGGRTPQESYLSIGKIIEACTTSGADAVHPGYGFLSENAGFAQACADSGLTFIGPAPRAILAMGNKARAKELMIEAGVPCVPGYHGKAQDLESLAARGREIGFPLMIKAAAGGGGRGLRLAHAAGELPNLLKAARAESVKAFGSGELLLERALTRVRHIEIQVMGDCYGNVLHLGERDCSIQRRHQKVIEESPSPAVTESLRSTMGAAAVTAARAIDYVGAGTVEFLLDEAGSFYFLEMNTRLQVEHPVTELVSGVDLVEWQIQVAAGQPLTLRQGEVKLQGHAIEARLYAEDPHDHFRPQVGRIMRWTPPAADLARTDHGLNSQDEVSPYYDSMLAKIIAHGPDRESARRRLEKALAETTLFGIRTNREFLLHCLKNPEFSGVKTGTDFIDRIWKPVLDKGLDPDLNLVAMAAAIYLQDELPADEELAGWCNTGDMHSVMKLLVDDSAILDMRVQFLNGSTYRLWLADKVKTVSLLRREDHSAQLLVDDVQHKVRFLRSGQDLHISSDELTYVITDVLLEPKKISDTASDGSVLSPSNGLIGSIAVQIGQYVEKGSPVCTIESMKLVQTICAPLAGLVTAVFGEPGQQIKAKQLIAQIAPSEQLSEVHS